jgi:hypothetical protein
VTYDEWITYGIMQKYCTRAECVVHETAELVDIAEAFLDHPIEWDDPECLPGVILFPPQDES